MLQIFILFYIYYNNNKNNINIYDVHGTMLFFFSTCWIRLFRRPSKPFPRVKTPAAYVRMLCYPPARFSNFVKDFLVGAYHCTRKPGMRILSSKESQHVVFCWRGGETIIIIPGTSVCYWEGCLYLELIRYTGIFKK
jgi:hypothetical protein